ncbi:scoloptoxin SSD14-like [Diabrotica virgifera virgifera]|uniref:Glutathione hydrolase 1 proenzyme-like n=1 Tax=Diabrotica virgifera virgifera TaxID=50390 RepID=A0A6P7FJJ0_DIAVI|nr:scoloptoxin SSD14-like [Diabrotica virgifera virgifera]XP_028133174.1 scoloptoxin SSD14-like [Diabrotica virgifera virgifera]XP_028133178.1 scoloptoxin SSD14-like [Diabrotica virgifera virgifera]
MPVLQGLLLLLLAGSLTAMPNPLSTSGLEGAVVSNAPGCAEVGRDILKKGKNAIDAVIATAFCEGVGNPTTMGVGGGFLATYYNRAENIVYSINSREMAPSGATEDMFVSNQSLAQRGGLSVAVPGETRGYWILYNKFGGGVPWSALVEPTIKICEEGIEMNELTYNNVRDQIDVVRADPGLREIFINPATNQVYKKGETYKRVKLAQTLRVIAREGGNALHNGSLTKKFVADIKANGGIITAKDLADFKVEFLTPVNTTISGKQIYSVPLPGAGIIMTYILNILENYLPRNDHLSVKTYQRIVEALKYGYAMRSSLGDQDFVPGLDDLITKLSSKRYAADTRKKITDLKTFNEATHYGATFQSIQDHGTANLCVWGPNGDGISLTSSINYILGAGFVSESTGIILNDSMDDFSTPGLVNEYGYPPSPSNFIRPGKRPQSSMCPTIILDGRNDLFMVVGGAGGSKITSSVMQVILNRLYFNMDVESASGLQRVHHQLFPMTLDMEDEWIYENPEIVKGLQSKGHNITFSYPDGFVAVTAISLDKDSRHLVGVHDKRRRGSVAYM